MTTKQILAGFRSRLEDANPCLRSGRLEAAVGPTLLATLPGAKIGERVVVGPRKIPADVAGFRDDRVVLLPAAGTDTLTAGLAVAGTGGAFRVPFTERLVGHVLTAGARRLDGGSLPPADEELPVESAAPTPLERVEMHAVLPTGIRVLDGLVTLARGQRMGLFAGPGLGKSTMLAQIARNCDADCTVLCLVGERGREVTEFIRQDLGTDGLARSVVVCATSDAPPAERARALPVATTIAEGFRSRGRSVVLLVDSLTRHARALREIAVSAGEPPGRRGFPASVFDRLARIVERTGTNGQGSITAVYTVLTEGDREEDPVAQEVQALLDGHIVLDPALAAAGCYPAVSVTASLSRLMDRVVDPGQQEAARRVRALASTYEDRRDLIAVGAYEPGSESATDSAIELRPGLEAFIRQRPDEAYPFESTRAALLGLIEGLRP